MLESIGTSVVAAGLVAAPLAGVGAVAASAAPSTIISVDFDDQTLGGWEDSGGSQRSFVDDGDGGYALQVTGRSADYVGIQTPAGALAGLVPGEEYEFSMRFRLAEGTPASSARLVMKPMYKWLGNKQVTDEWTTISETWTIPADASPADLQLYVGTDNLDPAAPYTYLVDDILVTGADGAEPVTVLTTDFEDDTLQGWGPRGTGEGDPDVTVVQPGADGTDHAAQVAGRVHQGQGMQIDVAGIAEANAQYEVEAWVRFAEGTGTALTLSARTVTGTTETFSNLVSFTGLSQEWTKVEGTFTMPTYTDAAELYLETPWADGAAGDTSTFLVDEVTVRGTPPAVIQDLTPLKETVDFPLGVAIDGRETVGSGSELLTRHFNQITAENHMKPEAWYDAERNFTPHVQGDQLMQFAQDQGLGYYGHVLVWHAQTPAWFFQDEQGQPLTTSEGDKQVLRDRMRTHIFDVAEHLATEYGEFGSDTNPLVAWDVVNEVVADSGQDADGLRRSDWYRVLGEEFIDLAFRYADEAFNEEYAAEGTQRPVKLFINDYNTEQSGKQDRYYALVQRLLQREVPIDGVGHQFHVSLAMPVSALADALERFEGLGLQQAVTEFDVTTGTPVTEALRIEQGYYYRDAFRVFRDHAEDLFSVTVWGLTDGRSWRNENGAPLLFDDRLQAKPAYYGAADQDLPARVRTANVFAGDVALDDAATSAPEWDRLRLHQIADGAAFQLRWSPDHLTAFVAVADDTEQATDGVTFTLGDDELWFGRDGEGDVDGVATEEDGGWLAVVHLPAQGLALGANVGLDVAVTDGDRTDSWSTPGTLGSLTLVEELSYVQVAEAASAPEIDGEVDAVWADAATVTTGKQVSGTGTATADVRSLWRDDTLYLLLDVTDDVVDVSGSNPWEQDSVEVYVDAGNWKNGAYRYDDTQIRVSATNQVSFGTGDETFQRNRVQSQVATTATGYRVEMAVSLLEDGGLGTFHGLDLQVNDATGGVRDGITNWADPTGAGYQSTARWGVAELVDEVTAPVPSFPDVTEGNEFRDQIAWLVQRGITEGYSDGTFRPTAPVTRQAMAAFLYRYDGSDWEPAPGTQTFRDVTPDHPFWTEIEWMAAQGLSEGYADGSFGPTASISRQAMAAFLHRLAGEPTASATAQFTDVPAGHPFAAAIAWMQEAEIAQGYADGSYGTTRAVSRQAMAAFLFRFDEATTQVLVTPWFG